MKRSLIERLDDIIRNRDDFPPQVKAEKDFFIELRNAIEQLQRDYAAALTTDGAKLESALLEIIKDRGGRSGNERKRNIARSALRDRASSNRDIGQEIVDGLKEHAADRQEQGNDR